MFRIVFLVEDKNLPQVLRDVAGKAKDLDVRPVVNILPSLNKVRAKTGGDVQSMLMEKLPQTETFGVDKIMAALDALGRPSSRTNAMGYVRAMGRNSNLITVARNVYMLNGTREE